MQAGVSLPKVFLLYIMWWLLVGVVTRLEISFSSIFWVTRNLSKATTFWTQPCRVNPSNPPIYLDVLLDNIEIWDGTGHCGTCTSIIVPILKLWDSYKGQTTRRTGVTENSSFPAVVLVRLFGYWSRCFLDNLGRVSRQPLNVYRKIWQFAESRAPLSRREICKSVCLTTS